MKKYIFTLSCIFITCHILLSFNWKGNNDNKKSQSVNDKILVIPYQSSMYFCNNDQYICKESKITPGKLNFMIRNSIAQTMQSDLAEYFYTSNISEQVGDDGKSDVDKLYSVTRYRQETKPLVAFYRNKPAQEPKNLWGLLPEKKEKGAEVLITNPDNPNLKKHLYFRAEFTNDSVISNFSNTYGVGYFLFINNFEMENHFKDCTDMHNNTSKRDLYVHFTLLDSKRNFVDGGVVCATFESSTNDVKEILKNNIGVISSMIVSQIKPKIKA